MIQQHAHGAPEVECENPKNKTHLTEQQDSDHPRKIKGEISTENLCLCES